MISKISKVLQKYHNPDPIARLIGPTNETKVQFEGEYAFRKAAAFSKKEAQRSKRHYGKFAKSSKLEQSDLVLVRKKSFQEKHKIADHWEKDSYEIVKQKTGWFTSLCSFK